MPSAEPVRDKKQVGKLADYYLKRGKLRNYLLIVMGIYTALRISDLLRLTWGDVYDFDGDRPRSHITLTEHKTGKRKTLAMNRQILNALQILLSVKRREPREFLFRSNRKTGMPIGRVQAWRIIRLAARESGISGRVSCHSLRKTFGYHAWRKGTQAVLLMDIYNHSSFEVTRRYLGISQEDRDRVYLEMDFG